MGGPRRKMTRPSGIPRAVTRAARAVCRLHTDDGIATGFLLCARLRGEWLHLLVTAAHALPAARAAQRASVVAEVGPLSLSPRRTILTLWRFP